MSYSTPLRQLIHFMASLAQASPQDPGSFDKASKSTSIPSTNEDMASMLSKLSSVPPSHYLAVLNSLDPQSRVQLHESMALFTQAVSSSVPDIIQAVQALRVMIFTLCPAVQQTAEDKAYGTADSVHDTYTGFEDLAKTIRPDDTNPKIAKQQQSLASTQQQVKNLETRLMQFGTNPADPSSDVVAINSLKSTNQKIVIVLGIIAGILVIGVIVLLIFYFKKPSAQVSKRLEMVGGGVKQRSVFKSIPENASTDFSNWGYPNLDI
jgi:hypothetical protein